MYAPLCGDEWCLSSRLIVVHYSVMATRIQVFTELCVCVPVTATEALTLWGTTFKRASSSMWLVTIAALNPLKRIKEVSRTTIRATISERLPFWSSEELISWAMGGANICTLWVWFWSLRSYHVSISIHRQSLIELKLQAWKKLSVVTFSLSNVSLNLLYTMVS